MAKFRKGLALFLALVMCLSMMNLTVFADNGNQSSVVNVDGLAITEEPALTCGQEESEGHTHGPDCYTTEQILTCEIPENHTHTIDCYARDEMGYEIEIDEQWYAVSGLTCDIPEGHVHSAECYTEEQVLTCELAESEGHTHTDACYAVPETVEPQPEAALADKLPQGAPGVNNPTSGGNHQVTVTKEWVGDENYTNHHPSVTVTLQWQRRTGYYDFKKSQWIWSSWSDGWNDYEPVDVELNDSNNWTNVWDGLPSNSYDFIGFQYKYQILETTASEEYRTSIVPKEFTLEDEHDSVHVTITNTLKDEYKTHTLTINKKWAGDLPKDKQPTVTFTVTGTGANAQTYYAANGEGDTYTVNNLPNGEYTITESDATVEGYTLNTSGNTTVSINGSDTTATITNTYTRQLGSLTIAKTVSGGPDDADSKGYKFTVTGPSYPGGHEVTITGANSTTLEKLIPGEYTVTEQDSSIKNYNWNASGAGTVTVKANEKANINIINTYTEKTNYSLTIQKAVSGLSDASNQVFTFTVTGPNGYSNTATITGEGNTTLSGLKAGKYTVTEQNTDVDGYTLNVTGSGGSVILGDDNPTDTVTVTNTYTPITGNLTIAKEVKGDAGVKATSMEFKFTVTGPNGYSTTFELQNGEKKDLEGLVPGTYTVTEQDADIDGYTLSTTGDGIVTVEAYKTSTAAVINTYSRGKGSLIITKQVVNGGSEASSKAYSFTVTGPDGYNETFELKNNESKTLNELSTGEYTVTEADANIDGYTLEVTGDGVVTVETGKTTTAAVTNTYTRETGSLIITKTVKGGGDEAASKIYTFNLTGPDDYSNTITITGNNSATLEGLPAGEYTVTEADANIDGYTLNTTIPNEGKVTVTANGTATVTVTNTYTQKLYSFQVLKVDADDNDILLTGAVFTLTGKDNKTYTAESGTDGIATFHDIPMGEYTLTEAKAPEHYNATETEYKLTINGKQDAGPLTDLFDSDAGTVNESGQLVIENEWNPDPVTVELSGTKMVEIHEGSNPSETTFTFTLTDAENGTIVDTQTVNLENARNNAGHFTFKQLTFGKADIDKHTYIVTEAKGDAAGWAYDSNDYEVTVIVTREGNELKAVVTSGDGITFTNTYTPASVEQGEGFKLVTNLTGPVPSSATNSFTFELNGGELDSAQQITVNYAAGEKDKKTASFAPLTFDRAGTYTYNIKEVQGSQPGYSYDSTTTTVTVEVEDHDGKLEITSTTYSNSDSGQTSVAEFTNIFNPGKLTFWPTINKVIDGEEPSVPSTFNFEMRLNTETTKDGAVVTKANASVEGSGSASFEVEIISPGTYTFSIFEKDGDDSHYKYDSSVITLTLEIGVRNTNSNKGLLFIQSQSYTDEATFTNTYDPEDVTFTPAVSKTVEGDAPKNETFSFAIAADENNPKAVEMPENATMTGSDDTTFGDITFTKAGTYNFTITEVNSGIPGYTYDNSVWTLTVKVEDVAGQLKVSSSAYAKNGETVEGAEAAQFTNTYNVTETTYTPLVNKVVDTGNFNPVMPTFSFSIEAGEGNPMPKSNTATVNNIVDGAGSANFESITYTKAGTYTYTIKETAGTEAGWTYDDSEWTLTVTVTDVNAVLTASATYTKDGETATTAQTAQFTNAYDPEDITFTPAVHNTVKTNGFIPSQTPTFNFTIEPANNAPMPDITTVTVNNETENEAKFGGITFANAGTYTYTIKEEQPDPIPGWTYDSSVWTLTVEVEDVDSKLTVTSATYDKSDPTNSGAATIRTANNGSTEPADAAEFTNEYIEYYVRYQFAGAPEGTLRPALPDERSYVEGADVSVTISYSDVVVTNPDGSTTTYQFVGWDQTSFKMPGNDVTIIGTWDSVQTTPQPSQSPAPSTEPSESPSQSPAPSTEPGESPSQSPAPSVEPSESPTESPVPSTAPSEPEDNPTDIPDDDPPLAEDPTENEDPEDNPVDLPDDDPPLAEDPTENDDPEDEPPVELPDDDPPLSQDPTDPENPDTPENPDPEPDTPPVDIPDDDPPLSEGPEDPEPPVDLPDDDPPLGEDPGILIPDPEVPMDPAPQTGDNFAASAWMALFIASTLGLAVLYFEDKKKAN